MEYHNGSPSAIKHGLPSASGEKKQLASHDEVSNEIPPSHDEVSNEIPPSQEVMFSTSSIAKIMRQVLPPEARISADAKDMVQNCAKKFIKHATSIARRHGIEDKRVKVAAEDVIHSMKELNFVNHVDLLKIYLEQYRKTQRFDGVDVNVPSEQKEPMPAIKEN